MIMQPLLIIRVYSRSKCAVQNEETKGKDDHAEKQCKASLSSYISTDIDYIQVICRLAHT